MKLMCVNEIVIRRKDVLRNNWTRRYTHARNFISHPLRGT